MAIDMGAPGFDNDSGFGITWADAALKAILELTPVDFDGDGRSDIGIYPFAEHTPNSLPS